MAGAPGVTSGKHGSPEKCGCLKVGHIHGTYNMDTSGSNVFQSPQSLHIVFTWLSPSYLLPLSPLRVGSLTTTSPLRALQLLSLAHIILCTFEDPCCV